MRKARKPRKGIPEHVWDLSCPLERAALCASVHGGLTEACVHYGDKSQWVRVFNLRMSKDRRGVHGEAKCS
jgi:hypothetical protein